MQHACSVRQVADDEDVLLGHKDVLYRYAVSLTRSGPEADDLVQEAYSRAFQAQARGQVIRNPRPYLMRLVHNLFIDKMRAARNVVLPEQEEAAEPAQEMQLMVQEVFDAMATLPEAQRDILWRAGVEGMRYAEIAEELELAEGTVTSRLSRARAALRARLGWSDQRLIS